MEKKRLESRFRWLLETMCEYRGIDVQEIDSELDFWENKAAIEAKYGIKLVLNLDKLENDLL